jgi:hypothetical protein
MLARLMCIWKAYHHANIAAAAHPSAAVGILAGAGFQELPVGGVDKTSHRFHNEAGIILAFKRKTFIGSYCRFNAESRS